MAEALGVNYSVRIDNRRILDELAKLIINLKVDKDPQALAALCKKTILPSIVFEEKRMHSTSSVSGQKIALDGNYDDTRKRVGISKLTLNTLLRSYDNGSTDQVIEKYSQKWLAYILAHELRHWIQYRFPQKRKLKHWLMRYGELLLKYAWIITGIYSLVFLLVFLILLIWHPGQHNIGAFLPFYITSILYTSLGSLALVFLIIGRTIKKINGFINQPWNVWLNKLNKLDHKIRYSSLFKELDASYFAEKAVQRPSWLNLIEIKKLF